MKRIPAGILLEGFQIEGTAKGMHSLGQGEGGEWGDEMTNDGARR